MIPPFLLLRYAKKLSFGFEIHSRNYISKIINQTYLPLSSAFLEIIFRVRLKHNICRKNGYVEDAQK